MHTDLRSWLQEVDQHGELRRISGAGWDLEMAGISEIIASKPDSAKPAILFDDIPGFPKGYRTLFGVLGSVWRVAKSLGLPEDETRRMNLLQAWHNKVKDLPICPAT